MCTQIRSTRVQIRASNCDQNVTRTRNSKRLTRRAAMQDNWSNRKLNKPQLSNASKRLKGFWKVGTNLLYFFLAFQDYRREKKLRWNRKSLTDQPHSEYHLMETRKGRIPIFRWRRRITRLRKRVDVHGPTTTVQGRCALATDTPTPMVNAILWSMTTQPRGHLSCEQSKN
jgi:hypothetical protein